MELPSWLEELPAAVTVTDATGEIIAMNQRAAETFASEGGRALLGSNVLDCHPPPSRNKLAAMLAGAQANHYTTARGERRRMIHQLPWFRDGVFAGMLEIAVDVPALLPHFERS